MFTTDQAFRAEAALPDRVFALGTSYMPVGEGHMRRETAIGVTGPDAMLALRPTLQRGRYYDRQSAGTAEPPCLVAPAMAGPSSNPVAIGDRLHIGGIQCQVIGVLGDAFGGVFPFAAAIWLPMTPALVRAIPQGAGGFPWLALYAAGEDAEAGATPAGGGLARGVDEHVADGRCGIGGAGLRSPDLAPGRAQHDLEAGNAPRPSHQRPALRAGRYSCRVHGVVPDTGCGRRRGLGARGLGRRAPEPAQQPLDHGPSLGTPAA
ncbi:MAG: ABC transporter permease [Pseudomonadota bacterium]